MTSSAKTEAYRSYLEERFQGEVYGEATMRTMAQVCADTDPERAAKLRVLEQLERETKERLLPAVKEAGGSGEPNPARIEEGERLGVQMASAPWGDLMRGMCTEIEKLVDEFERSEALAPAGRESVLKAVTDHERALLEFARREIDGNDAGESLAPVRALLRS
jgi:hypothetical protein